MTKEKIIEKLLKEKNITTEEAVVLLKEKSLAVNGFMDLISYPKRKDNKVPYNEICGCTICGCSMGNKLVEPGNSGNFYTDNTFTTSSK